MERVIEILIQYEQADFAQRIYLFLQYPGMRDAFVEIERKGCCSLKGLSYVTDQHSIHRGIFCAALVPQSNHRDKEIEKSGCFD